MRGGLGRLRGHPALAGLLPKKRNKYNARKVKDVDGTTIDSKAEFRRLYDLRNLQRAGEISELETQVRFKIQHNGVHICDYKADFRYREKGAVIVEDCKGVRTKEYRLKAKLMQAFFGIDIRET